ncbi:MAG: C4-type zinc ribbon domain-containing protein [Candidatus Dadabacteria bacterium]|nr:C4-type zinc ribbon domain-containing protein [Candidatus Dadabacteria bacterium]
MRDQISALEALQQLDLELGVLEDDLEKYPQKISRLNEEIEDIKNSLAKAKEEFNQLRKKKTERELELAGNKDKIKKTEVKLFEIKTYKEYEALQKELSEVKRINADLEENIIKEMETLEELEALVKEKDNALSERAKEYENAINGYNLEINEIKKAYETKNQEKKKLASLINPDALSLYERIRRRNGVVLVQARNELCTGCNMNIPPQLFNEVLTSTRMIQCPNCHRILYCEETTEAELQTA